MKFHLENLTGLSNIIKELAVGLLRLSFSENFESFEISGTLAAGTEVSYRNSLTVIPKGYIIIKQKGNGLITAGEAAWTPQTVSLKNHGAVSVEFTAVFLKR